MVKIKNTDNDIISVIHNEYINIQNNLGSLIDDYGIVKTGMRFRYLDLKRKAEAFKTVLLILRELRKKSISELIAGPRDKSKDSMGVVS